jgi:hypothetical protein
MIRHAIGCLTLAGIGWCVTASAARAQSYDPRPPREVRSGSPFGPESGATPDPETAQQIQNIMRDHPAQAEQAARAFVVTIDRNRMNDGGQPLFIVDGVAQPTPVPVLEQLKAGNADAYWREVATLVMQFEMFRRVVPRDSARARAMAAMFGTEFEARIIQRGWRGASEAQHTTMRSQLETLMTHHFEMEDELRALELRDIERRLADARAESERRRTRRAEMVRWSVDDIIHAAERP